MITPETKQRLDDVPVKALVAWIYDAVAGDSALATATFFLSMAFPEVEPEELIDYALPRIRAAALQSYARTHTTRYKEYD